MRKVFKIGMIIASLLFIIFGGIFCGLALWDTANKDVVVKKNVKIIAEDANSQDKPYKVEEGKLVFEKDPNYKVGDIVVSGVTEESPYGYIRRITSKEVEDGEFHYYTEYATLLDVFEKAHVKETIELTVDQNMLTQMSGENQVAYNGDMLGGMVASELFNTEDNEDMDDWVSLEFENKEGIFDVEGEVGFKIWLDFSLDIEDGELEWGMSVNARTQAEMLFGFSHSEEKEWEKELLTVTLPTLTIWAGPVPIVISNDISCKLESEFEISGDIGTKAEAGVTFIAGFIYTSKDNKVEPRSELVTPDGGIEWDTSVGVEGKVNGGVFIYLTTLLYDCAGAEIGIGLEAQAEGEVRLGVNDGLDGNLRLSIYPQLKGDIIVEIPILGKGLWGVPIFEKSLDPIWKVEWPEEESDGNTEDETVENDIVEDEILVKLQNGDFSDFAGTYKPLEIFHDWLGGGGKVGDMYLDKKGIVSGCETIYSKDTFLQIPPIKVAKNEDGSYLCTVTESEIVYHEDHEASWAEEDIYSFVIYPKGVVGDNLYGADEAFLRDTDYIEYTRIDGGVYNILCYKEEGLVVEGDCYNLYKNAIYATIKQNETQSKIYFETSIYQDWEEPEDWVGGYTRGYPSREGELLYALKDIRNKEDGYPELFIGVKNQDDVKVLAVYTFSDVDVHGNDEPNVDLMIVKKIEDSGEILYVAWTLSIYESDFTSIFPSKSYGFGCCCSRETFANAIDDLDLEWKDIYSY